MQPVNNERVTGTTDQFVARLPLVRDNTGSELQKFVHVYSQGVHKLACQSGQTLRSQGWASLK